MRIISGTGIFPPIDIIVYPWVKWFRPAVETMILQFRLFIRALSQLCFGTFAAGASLRAFALVSPRSNLDLEAPMTVQPPSPLCSKPKDLWSPRQFSAALLLRMSLAIAFCSLQIYRYTDGNSTRFSPASKSKRGRCIRHPRYPYCDMQMPNVPKKTVSIADLDVQALEFYARSTGCLGHCKRIEVQSTRNKERQEHHSIRKWLISIYPQVLDCILE